MKEKNQGDPSLRLLPLPLAAFTPSSWCLCISWGAWEDRLVHHRPLSLLLTFNATPDYPCIDSCPFVPQTSAVAVASSEKLALTAQKLPLMSQAGPPPAVIEEPSLIGTLASSQHLKGKPGKVRITLEGNFNQLSTGTAGYVFGWAPNGTVSST